MAVITIWPVALSPAATFAWPKTLALIALIRSPTVSVPVDVYVVVLAPSLTVIVPFARMPRVNSDVLVESGAVPVPEPGAARVEAPAELEELEPEELEPDAGLLDEDEVEPVDPLVLPLML